MCGSVHSSSSVDGSEAGKSESLVCDLDRVATIAREKDEGQRSERESGNGVEIL
jgi:hypothetical protein